MSFGRESAVCPRHISPHKGFFGHRMSGGHPMSNFDDSDLGNEISFAIIMSFRCE